MDKNDLKFHVFSDERFVDLNLYQFGYEKCEPLHSYGPYARNHYLFHYVISGKGYLRADGEYEITAGHGFLIEPNQVTTYFADEFGIPAKDFTLSHICVKDSEKPSTEHDGEVRYYEYTLYRASVTVMPDAWRSTEFHVGAKDCRWMTLDEMLADPVINKINHDVVAMVRDNL